MAAPLADVASWPRLGVISPHRFAAMQLSIGSAFRISVRIKSKSIQQNPMRQFKFKEHVGNKEGHRGSIGRARLERRRLAWCSAHASLLECPDGLNVQMAKSCQFKFMEGKKIIRRQRRQTLKILRRVPIRCSFGVLDAVTRWRRSEGGQTRYLLIPSAPGNPIKQS